MNKNLIRGMLLLIDMFIRGVIISIILNTPPGSVATINWIIYIASMVWIFSPIIKAILNDNGGKK